MDPTTYFKDLSDELRAVKNRVRNLIGGAHWPSDGAWKESVIRTIVRQYLPTSMTVGSGFVITPDGVSTQIDLLVCDDSAPVLFRDGDFVIATADCVRAIVEVKTSLDGQDIHTALSKLNRLSSLIRARCAGCPPFLGLLSYEPTSTALETVLSFLVDANGKRTTPAIGALSFGTSQFIRHWDYEPSSQKRLLYDAWHAYDLPETAPGYFVHNLIERLFPQAFERAENMWYPPTGKEPHLISKSAARHK